jgi:hypothetical protein
MCPRNHEEITCWEYAMTDLSAKYRPKKWSDIVGQDKAVSEVRESLKQGWGGRAWWIVGESGTGCTSIAMLIARQGCTEERVCSVYSGQVDGAMAMRMANKNPGKEKTVANRAYVIDRPAGLPSDSASLLTSVLPCLHANICVVFTHTFAEDRALRIEHPDALGVPGTPYLIRDRQIHGVRRPHGLKPILHVTGG